MQSKFIAPSGVCPFLNPTRSLIVSPDLATAIGLNEAIVLRQVHFWTAQLAEKQDRKRLHEGRYWTFNSHEEWRKQFPFWSQITVRRTLESLCRPAEATKTHLKRQPLLLSKRLGKTLCGWSGSNQTLFYTVATENLSALWIAWEQSLVDDQIDHLQMSKLITSYSESPSQKKSDSGAVGACARDAAAGEVSEGNPRTQPIKCRNDEHGRITLLLDLETPLEDYLGRTPPPSMVTSLRVAVQRAWRDEGKQVTQHHLDRARFDAGYFVRGQEEGARWSRQKEPPRSWRAFEYGLHRTLHGEDRWATRGSR